MRTKLVILGIVVACLAVGGSIFMLLLIALGTWPGLATGVGLVGATVVGHSKLVGPRLARWGATDEEITRHMPGDDLLPDAPSATRAITIDAPARDIWPWLVQLGYGRAGWYSYDWIDNDGKPSAERIIPELQHLKPGDQILMIPGMGFTVRDLAPDRFILTAGGDTATWCMELVSLDETHTRLINRWRDSWRAHVTPTNALWITITGVGSFIMEQKMLRGIKRRAETNQEASPTIDGAELSAHEDVA